LRQHYGWQQIKLKLKHSPGITAKRTNKLPVTRRLFFLFRLRQNGSQDEVIDDDGDDKVSQHDSNTEDHDRMVV
jgi:hypothetical protein